MIMEAYSSNRFHQKCVSKQLAISETGWSMTTKMVTILGWQVKQLISLWSMES